MLFNHSTFHAKYIYPAIILLCLSICIPLISRTAQSYARAASSESVIATNSPTTQPSASVMSDLLHTDNSYLPLSPSRTPVYFLSIGGPNFIENTNHPAFIQLTKVGREITTKVKPKAVVVFSAHWQGSPNNKLQINVAEKMDIIYDFYGFPPHYYETKFPNIGSPQLAEKIIEKLTSAGIEVDKVHRGLDHGVWAGFIAAFDPNKNPLNVPIVQVSLYDNEDVDQHYRLGQAIESLRDEGVVIIVAGMAVHNLYDFRRIMATEKTMPYAFTFDQALKEAATSMPNRRQAKLSALLRRSDARQAHPTLEHLLPIYVGAGAAGSDVGEQLWTLPEKSLSWAQYRFGKVVPG